MARRDEREELSLVDAAQALLDECRMVLPGIQAIFGFQLIAVFNERFAKDLERPDQLVHLCALGLMALAIALVMTPAAYHRHRGYRDVSDHFLRMSSRLLLASMLPLAAGLSLDFYLIARLVLDAHVLAAALAASLLATMMFFWFAFPRLQDRHSPSAR
jgi:uncharacterized PurR-regulated membrane protein YhhQ (DUF165 family)